VILFNRLVPIITPLIVFIGLELFFLNPRWIYAIGPLLIVILGAATWKIIGKGLITVGARWFYLLTPISFLTSGALFALFLEQPWVKHSLALAIAIFVAVFLENIFVYIYQHEKYQTHSLENVSNYLNLASMFLFNSGLFGFFIFLNLPLWQISLLALAIFFILTVQTIWVNKIKLEAAWLYIFIICLILLEVFWATSFLSIAFYVSGLIVATVFYFTNNLMRLHLSRALNKKIVRRYSLLCGSIIFLILATAQWI
jgi:hypothetical protein